VGLPRNCAQFAAACCALAETAHGSRSYTMATENTKTTKRTPQELFVISVFRNLLAIY